MKKQFVSELELISQLSVPNAVIGPISLCFLQLASLIHCGERRGEKELERSGMCQRSWRERDGGRPGGGWGAALHVCRGLWSASEPTPWGKGNTCAGMKTVRCIN